MKPRDIGWISDNHVTYVWWRELWLESLQNVRVIFCWVTSSLIPPFARIWRKLCKQGQRSRANQIKIILPRPQGSYWCLLLWLLSVQSLIPHPRAPQLHSHYFPLFITVGLQKPIYVVISPLLDLYHLFLNWSRSPIGSLITVLAAWRCWNTGPWRDLVLLPHCVLWTSHEVTGRLCPWAHLQLFLTPPGLFLIKLPSKRERNKHFLVYSKMKKRWRCVPHVPDLGCVRTQSGAFVTWPSWQIFGSILERLHPNLEAKFVRDSGGGGVRRGQTYCPSTRRKKSFKRYGPAAEDKSLLIGINYF